MKHEELKDLILVFEDLTGEQKTVAETHLAECDQCRSLLKSLQETEKVDAGLGDLPADPTTAIDPLGHLCDEERSQARASRQKLMNTVRDKRVVAVPGSSGSNWWRTNTNLLGMALAASLALIIWMPWQNQQADFVQDFRLTPPRVVRGENSLLAPGDAFVMRFQMGVEGWPIVVLIQEGAAPLLMHPTANDPAIFLPADRAVVLPKPGSNTVWRVEPRESGATYLVTISKTREPNLDQLQALLDEAGATENPVDQLNSLFEDHFGYCWQF